MNIVKILIEGYAKVNPDGTWDATCTTIFIDTGKHKIIMDPGCHRSKLLAALKKAGLGVGDIDMVFISHYHPDHNFLIGLFDKATVYDSNNWQKDNLAGEFKEKFLPDTNIEVVKTPGHAPEHASLLVPTKEGKVLIAADVFWWQDGKEQKVDINSPDEFASDTTALILSRSHALKIADYIIPGHGQKFTVSK